MKLKLNGQSVNLANILNKNKNFCPNLTFKIPSTFFKEKMTSGIAVHSSTAMLQDSQKKEATDGI